MRAVQADEGLIGIPAGRSGHLLPRVSRHVLSTLDDQASRILSWLAARLPREEPASAARLSSGIPTPAPGAPAARKVGRGRVRRL